MTISFWNFLNNLITIPNFSIIALLISGVMFISGLSDAPNSIATCVSTRCLSPKKALMLSGIFNLLGIILMTFISTEVAQTMFYIVNFGENLSENMIALASALIAIVMWSVITWVFKLPSSQSHALIAGVTGAAIALRGNLSGVNFDQWKKVLYGLIFINLFAFILGFFITKLIEKICKNMDRRKTNKFFTGTQILGAAAMSFMDGAQDGQKFMGIFLLGVALSNGVTDLTEFSIPFWLMIYCSVLMTLGSAIGGLRIIKTVGTKVSKLEKYQGTAADLSSSICLFASSAIGIPASSTHSKNCAVMGVGASKRFSNVNWNVAKNMIATWFITFPGCGLLGFVLTKLLLGG